jgi:hypothetical protein
MAIVKELKKKILLQLEKTIQLEDPNINFSAKKLWKCIQINTLN